MLVSESVQKGIELFKSYDPYWFEKVDISALNVSSVDLCPAAQIYGGFSTFVEMYHMSDDALWEHGLLTANSDGTAVHNTGELEMEWKKRILYLNIERRIDKGIKFLDDIFVFERDPWFMRVRLDVDIRSTTKCVLAQSVGFLYATCERLIFSSSKEDGQSFSSFVSDCNTFFSDRGFLDDATRLNVDTEGMVNMMYELYNHIWRIKIQDKCIEYQKMKEDSLA